MTDERRTPAPPPAAWRGILRRTAIAMCALASLHATAAAAQRYPARPIRFIVPFAAGGPGDFLTRLITPRLIEAWGQQVVVDNRGGANGILATEIAAKAGSDGYTLLLVSAGYTVNASLYPKLPYDPLRDFAPITLVASGPAIVVAHPSLPVHSIRELIAYARSRPGQINFASSGTGAPSHLAGELFQVMTGTKFVHVPYKGMAPGIVDLLAGQVQLAFPTISAGINHAKAGRLRALAVTSARRSPAAPDIPTVAEAGVPGYVASNWYGVVAPARTPRAVVEKINHEIARALVLPEVRARMLATGMEPVSNTPDEFAAYVKSEIGKWAKVIKAAGVKVE